MPGGSIKPEEQTNPEGEANTAGYRLHVGREALILLVTIVGGYTVFNAVEPMYDAIDDYVQPWPFAVAFTGLGTAGIIGAFALANSIIYNTIENRRDQAAESGEGLRRTRLRRR